jgi:hypothetical protein
LAKKQNLFDRSNIFFSVFQLTMLIGGQFGGEFKWHMVEISCLENAVALRADALD